MTFTSTIHGDQSVTSDALLEHVVLSDQRQKPNVAHSISTTPKLSAETQEGSNKLNETTTETTPTPMACHNLVTQTYDDCKDFAEVVVSYSTATPMNQSAAMPCIDTTWRAGSIHPFARKKPAAIVQQDPSSKTDKKKGKKGKNRRESINVGTGTFDTKASNAQEIGLTPNFEPKKLIQDAMGTLSTVMLSSTEMAISDQISEVAPAKLIQGVGRSSRSEQPKVTVSNIQQPKCSDINNSRTIAPALPLPVPFSRQPLPQTTGSSARSSETKLLTTFRVVGDSITADAWGDTSSPMSTKTAQEFQTPASSPLRLSASPPAKTSSRNNFIVGLSLKPSDQAHDEASEKARPESSTSALQHVDKTKKKNNNKKKNKNKRASQDITSDKTPTDVASSQTDGDKKSQETDNKPGEIKDGYNENGDKRDEPSTIKPPYRHATEETSPKLDADEKRSCPSQNAAFEKVSLLKENSSTISDSWAHVASRSQSTNTEYSQLQGLKNRSSNLPGSASSSRKV
jgi:hypothetical protein